MKLSIAFLPLAFVSVASASEFASASVNPARISEIDKIDAFSGIEYALARENYFLELIREDPLRGLLAMAEPNSEAHAFYPQLSAEELKKEADYFEKLSLECISAYESLRSAVHDGSISQHVMKYLLKEAAKRLWAQQAAIEIVDTTLFIFKMLAKGKNCIDMAEFMIISDLLELEPMTHPRDTWIAANKHKLIRLRGDLHNNLVSFGKMQKILMVASILDVVVSPRQERLSSTYGESAYSNESFRFTAQGRAVIGQLKDRVAEKVRAILTEVDQIADVELASYLQRIDYKRIIYAGSMIPEPISAIAIARANPRLLSFDKVISMKKQLIDFLNCMVHLCDIALVASGFYFQVSTILDLAKLFFHDDAVSIQDVLVL